MTTIKSYTDIEQSKKLAKLLPPESADMYWMHGKLDNVKQHPTPNIIGNDHDEPLWDDYDIPCWSLASLLNILPKTIGRYNKTLGWFDGSWHCDYMDEDSESMGYDTLADNPVDACYEMIIKLHELKLL